MKHTFVWRKYYPLLDRVGELTMFQTTQQGSWLPFGQFLGVILMQSSYANEESNLITVTFDNDKGTSHGVVAVVVIFLLVTAVSLSMFTWSRSQSVIPPSSVLLQPSIQGSVILDSNKVDARATILGQGDSDVSKSEGMAAELSTQENKRSRVGSVYWEKPQPGVHCLAFGTREYAAKLRNVPFYMNGMKICEETEVWIHGVPLPRPNSCERRVSY